MLLICVVSVSIHTEAREWLVGSSRTYVSPSQVSTLVHDGDTITLDPETYSKDVAHWTASDLLLRGIGGSAVLASGGSVYGGKAIWVISGARTTVENITFLQASCVDHNGAGIRAEGAHLTVLHCVFRDNEDGILAGALHPSTIVIVNSEFDHNGFGDGYSHNLYIGNVDTLIFRYNYSHHCRSGHELKSRANVNIIVCNRLSNESTGTASRNIDLPNGGTAFVCANIIEQGPLTENSNMIGFGLESLSNPKPQRLVLVNNTLVNDRGSGSFIQMQTGSDSLVLINNILAGKGVTPTNTNVAVFIDRTNLRVLELDSCHFANAAVYDYHLLTNSPAINAGTQLSEVGFTDEFVRSIYVHSVSSQLRCSDSKIDIGAYEYCESSAVVSDEDSAHRVDWYALVGADIQFSTLFDRVRLYSVRGECVVDMIQPTALHLSGLACGVYVMQCDQFRSALVVLRY